MTPPALADPSDHALPISGPSPVEGLPGLARELGLAWLGAKRDDQLSPLFGGTKVRKLDRLLTLPPWDRARVWTSVGGIGSGQLACLAAAAEAMGRKLVAHSFWQDPDPMVLENLAYLATRATVVFHADRARLVLSHPTLLRAGGGAAVVPAGASAVPGLLGIVDAAAELAAQVRAGMLPVPDVVVLPLGSGGTAVGLAQGLSMAGLPTRVRAVSVVERPLATRGRLRRMARALAAALPDAPPPAPLELVYGFQGQGYGRASAAGRAAAARLLDHGLPLEDVYGAKAMSALLADPPRGAHVLYWHTPRRGPLPTSPEWRDHLPASLRHRLDGGPDRGRRWFLGAGLATAAAGLTIIRTRGYQRYSAWSGRVLLPWEAEVLRAVAEAVLPPAPLDAALLDGLPARTDAFLVAMSSEARLELHALFVLVEQATALGGDLSRFTRLSPAERVDFLEGLERLGGLMAVAVRGIRDLALLGYYQDPSTWPALAYEGPWVRGPRRPSPYDTLRAPAGALP